MIADIHVHSRFSADSEADPDEVVRKAAEAGLPAVCFTDHIDWDYPVEGLVFDFDTDDYFRTMESVRQRWGEKIRVLIGVELGLQAHLAERYHELLASRPFDYVIGSQHLVRGMDPYYPETFEGASETEIYRAYFEETLADLRAFHEFDSMGHLDYIVRYGRKLGRPYSWREYGDVIDEILKLLVRYNIALEVNTAGIRKQLGFPNPHPEIIRRYRELGGTLVTVGSDSHKPYSLGFAFEQARDLLLSCGFTHYVWFEHREPKFVSLRGK